ncbi:tripartite tricarboxylate transporter substrate binding protein [Roseomonas hellenica]|uniref:Tripartite tricarboxylate transporter substrate binding protein n=1 Tax=Plastoroseomonas hellenica TaxID=2687306 RepID=A0ABS5ESJ8_9PROT|nr:tripartite tricarboxylate transporter substrate-binding protein [Plastoroseomonas hellenica]MBR0663271.1 tripartite tricarboxylate transporter substrate binding protein [Plastoroseomonas hellenica]
MSRARFEHAMRRRALLAIPAALAAPGLLRAQEAWPVRQARIIIPFAAGGPQDPPARIIAEKLSQRLGATFIVDNRPGAGGGLGAQQVAQAAPDGATLLFISSSISIIPTLQVALRFDPVRDLAPISLVCDVPAALLVRSDSRFDSLAAVLAAARASPGRLTYASGGVGSANHLAGALFAALAGLDLTHVPYRGISQAVTAIYTGEIDLIFGSTLEVLAHAREGRARLLGTTMPARLPETPEVPAIAEQVPGYAAPNWFSMFAPKGMAPPLTERLVAELARLRDDPDMTARLSAGAAQMRLDGPGPLAARLAEEVVKWRDVIGRANIRAD